MFGHGLETNGKITFAKIRTSIDICSTEKCKVTFGLKYIYGISRLYGEMVVTVV